MRRFVLIREEDESGVSGTGVVAEGVEFSNGKVAMTWFSHLGSVVVDDNICVVRTLHSHGKKTRIQYLDESTV